jgi:hypothetical protein
LFSRPFLRAISPDPGILGPLAIRDREQHIGMAWSAGFAPANQILAFQFPASIADREGK